MGMTALVHNSSVDEDDQGSCQKTFSERRCSWFPGGQAIWVNTAAVSLFSVSLSTSYGSRWKRATTAPFRKYCCFGRSNSQHFHRETTKIQGWSLRVPDWIFYLGKTNWAQIRSVGSMPHSLSHTKDSQHTKTGLLSYKQGWVSCLK